MKKEILKALLDSGKKPLVRLTDVLWDESWGQKGMLAEVVSYKYDGMVDDSLSFVFDYNKHREHNLALQPTGYYLSSKDDKTGTAFEAGVMKDITNIVEDVVFSGNEEVAVEVASPDTRLKKSGTCERLH